MNELGIALPIDDRPLREWRGDFDRLVDAGYDGVWTGELNAVEGLMPLALCAGWRPDVALSCAVLSVFTRTPGVLAMAAATLAELSTAPVRFGIGAGSAVIAETWNGVRYESPFQRVRETLGFLQRALAGEVSAGKETTFSSTKFSFARVPARPPALVLGVLGPRMQRLAAAEADGMVVNFLSAADMVKVADNVSTVRRSSDSTFEVTARVFVMASATARAVEMARRHVTGYLTVPAYAEFQRWLGRTTALTPTWDAWERGDRQGALASLPEEVVRDLVIAGPPAVCAPAIRAYAANGADVINVVLLPDGDETDSETRVRFLCDLGRELRALG